MKTLATIYRSQTLRGTSISLSRINTDKSKSMVDFHSSKHVVVFFFQINVASKLSG